MKRGCRGYTLTEILVSVAVVTILIGSLAPLAFNQISRARKASALRDISSLSEAIQLFRQDVKTFPDRSGGKPEKLGYLLTAGKAPKGLGKWAGPSGKARDHLSENAPKGSPYPNSGIAAWKGPYVASNPTDPWGHAYVISVAGLRGAVPARGWILSAGPDGTLNTDDHDVAIPDDSDDLGWRLR